MAAIGALGRAARLDGALKRLHVDLPENGPQEARRRLLALWRAAEPA